MGVLEQFMDAWWRLVAIQPLYTVISAPIGAWVVLRLGQVMIGRKLKDSFRVWVFTSYGLMLVQSIGVLLL